MCRRGSRLRLSCSRRRWLLGKLRQQEARHAPLLARHLQQQLLRPRLGRQSRAQLVNGRCKRVLAVRGSRGASAGKRCRSGWRSRGGRGCRGRAVWSRRTIGGRGAVCLRLWPACRASGSLRLRLLCRRALWRSARLFLWSVIHSRGLPLGCRLLTRLGGLLQWHHWRSCSRRSSSFALRLDQCRAICRSLWPCRLAAPLNRLLSLLCYRLISGLLYRSRRQLLADSCGCRGGGRRLLARARQRRAGVLLPLAVLLQQRQQLVRLAAHRAQQALQGARRAGPATTGGLHGFHQLCQVQLAAAACTVGCRLVQGCGALRGGGGCGRGGCGGRLPRVLRRLRGELTKRRLLGRRLVRLLVGGSSVR